MNVTLIGMVGVGKSSVGKKLAAKLGARCIDVDRLIEKEYGKSLQAIIDTWGEKKFLSIEARIIRGLPLTGEKKYVVSPGGSAVYSSSAMRFLKQRSVVIFLDAALVTIARHIRDKSSRGIIGAKRLTLSELYARRRPLYKKYADCTVRVTSADSLEAVVKKILRKVKPGTKKRSG